MTGGRERWSDFVLIAGRNWNRVCGSALPVGKRFRKQKAREQGEHRRPDRLKANRFRQQKQDPGGRARCAAAPGRRRFYIQQQKSRDASQAAAIAAQEAKQEKKEKTAEKQEANDSIGTVQKIMEQEGISGKVLATSYGHDPTAV